MGDDRQIELAFPRHELQTASAYVTHNGECLKSPSVLGAGTALGRTELAIRGIALVSSLAALIFLATDRQTRSFSVYTSVIVQQAAYSDMKALVYSVVTLGIAAVHSAVQILRCLFVASSMKITPSSTFAWTIFLLDQIMTYLILSSAAAAAQAAWLSEQGSDAFSWPKVCYLFEKFCKQVGAGIVALFLAFISLASISAISAFNVFANIDLIE
ncbi:hypothetical protein KP509_08G055900 [Ceratopteris richardii]|uniref:CASP-like protein n=1 Tax=Ceratopteris richardii TaxID=49495 RepID=A0A8T2UDE3_CERRI|nr:hypothetical protein KP509_08G055900 [Ceratopteris richardii]